MTSARALANQERKMQIKRLSRVAKTTLLSMATLMTFATVALLIIDRLYRPGAFVIDQLKLTGQFTYLTPEAVQSVIHKEPLGNFFSIELSQIKQRIEDMAWVKSADVRREWPHTLSVRVREHRPVMRWKNIASQDHHEGDQWVSLSGDLIRLEKPLQQHSATTLKGIEHDAKQLLTKALVWQKRLSSSKLTVHEVSLSASQSWTLTLSKLGQEKQHKFELLLGTENTEKRLQRFQTLFDTRLYAMESELIKIDARYPDGLAVQQINSESKATPVSMRRHSVIDGALVETTLTGATDEADESLLRTHLPQPPTAYAT